MVTESGLELAFSGRAPVVGDETTMVLLHVRVAATPVAVVVDCWRILARHGDMVSFLYLIALNLHVVLLVAGETAIILHDISVSA